MPKYYYSLYILLLLVSCSAPIEKVIEIELKGRKKILSEIIDPDKIRIKSNYIIVLESPSIDSFKSPIHVIDRDNLDYLFSIGRIGFGPGEISDATSVEFGESDSTLYVYSSIDKKYSEFSIEEVELANWQVNQKNDFFKAYSVLRFTDSTFLTLTVDYPARVVEFNSNGNLISNFGSLDNFSDRMDLDTYNLSQINMGSFGSNDSKTYFAIASLFTNRIEILNTKNKTFKSVNLEPKEQMKFDLVEEASGNSVYWDLSTPYQFRDIVLNEKNIIALYGGYSSKQIKTDGIIAKTVYIYSLSGELKAKLNLDTSIRSLDVNEDMTKLYGISTDADPGIMEFDLPKL
jgi:hypothetical protein